MSKRVLKQFFEQKIAQCSMNGRDFEKIQKISDHGKLVRLPTKCYLKRLNEKLYLENVE